MNLLLFLFLLCVIAVQQLVLHERSKDVAYERFEHFLLKQGSGWFSFVEAEDYLKTSKQIISELLRYHVSEGDLESCLEGRLFEGTWIVRVDRASDPLQYQVFRRKN